MGNRQKRSWLTRALLLTLSATALVAVARAAEVYRCVTPAGGVEFRQDPCPKEATSTRLEIKDRHTGWIPPQPEESDSSEPEPPRRPETDETVDRAAAARERREERCWTKRQQLDEVNWKLRRGYTVTQGERLRRQRSKYEDYLRRYCR